MQNRDAGNSSLEIGEHEFLKTTKCQGIWETKSVTFDSSQVLAEVADMTKQASLVHGSDGIQTHASEETGALIQRLRPLGHTTCQISGSLLLNGLGLHKATGRENASSGNTEME